MGRSSQEQAQKNRQKIVECAARLFREFGVDNVRVAEVMSGADMTIGGFYKHFESKDALVEEVFSLTFDQSSTTWRQLVEDCSKVREKTSSTRASFDSKCL